MSEDTLNLTDKDERRIANITNKISRDVINNLLGQAMSDLETKSALILKQVREDAKTRETVVGIKINNDDIVKFDGPSHPLLGNVLKLLKLGLNPLLVGPAGSGKTHIGEQSAKLLKLSYGHLCFSAGVSETWLFGRQTPHGFIEGEFSKLYKNGGLFLADELDAADPNLLLAINTALSNNHLYNPISGENITRHKDFYFVGTANTFGKGSNAIYTGRSRLDAATLDRFTVVEITYVPAIENLVCPNIKLATWLRGIRSEVEKRGSSEIISYRSFDKAFKIISNGFTPKELNAMLFGSWPQSLKDSVLREFNG